MLELFGRSRMQRDEAERRADERIAAGAIDEAADREWAIQLLVGGTGDQFDGVPVAAPPPQRSSRDARERAALAHIKLESDPDRPEIERASLAAAKGQPLPAQPASAAWEQPAPSCKANGPVPQIVIDPENRRRWLELHDRQFARRFGRVEPFEPPLPADPCALAEFDRQQQSKEEEQRRKAEMVLSNMRLADRGKKKNFDAVKK
jgi:hypothetical protein